MSETTPDPAAATTIEMHHRVQLGLLRAVEHHLLADADQAEAAEALARLLDFTRVHFQAEELLMKHHRYPGLDGHGVEHQRLLREAFGIAQAHGAGDLAVARETVGRLRAWILEHVDGPDAAFDGWCTRNGVVLE
jgi:hemerythrin